MDVETDAGHEQASDERDRREIGKRRVRENQPPQTFSKARPIREVGFEAPASAADQVIAHVGFAAEQPLVGCLPGAFDRSERHPDLRLSAPRRQFFDSATLSITTEEIHPSIHA